MYQVIEDKHFKKKDFSVHLFKQEAYEDCTFEQCDFFEGDLSMAMFLNCTFKQCNLSMINVLKTSFQNVHFSECKMFGIRMDELNPFALSFQLENCALNHTSFYQLQLRKSHFKHCEFREVDFTECDLSESNFDSCDFLNAVFEYSILEKADFRTSFNLHLDPEKNRIKNAHFDLTELPGLLQKYALKIGK